MNRKNRSKRKRSKKRVPLQRRNLSLRGCFKNNYELVNSLPTTDIVKEAMNKVDREIFCVHKDECYCDRPSRILMEQTISAPHMHAKAIEHLQEKLIPGASVLDVGSGSGYLTACFAEMVDVTNKNHRKRGKVVGIDIYKELVKYSNEKTKKFFPQLHTYSSRFKMIHGSGWDGYPKNSKKQLYDAIHVGASTDSIPMKLVDQLKKDGVLILPLKIGNQDIHTFCKITKGKNGNLFIDPKEQVRYVPLIKKKY